MGDFVGAAESLDGRQGAIGLILERAKRRKIFVREGPAIFLDETEIRAAFGVSGKGTDEVGAGAGIGD